MSACLVIERWYRDSVTLGVATFGNFKCVTLELPWRQNREDKSCIPAGRYMCKKIHSGKNGHCFEILDVPGRTDVQGHIGNFIGDILGCVVFGGGIRDIDNDGVLDVTNSTQTFSRLMKLLPDKFCMEIS